MDIVEKMASFYTKCNIFKAKENLCGSIDISEDPLSAYFKIVKNKKAIIDSINFTFLKDDNEWDIISVVDNKQSPLVFINTNTEKNISYVVLYSIVLVMIGINLKVSFKNIEILQNKSDAFFFLDSIASNAIFNNEDFDIHYFVDSIFANKILQYGKKLCFSLVLAFDKNLITKAEFIELIGFESKEAEEFFASYLPLALIAEIKEASV